MHTYIHVCIWYWAMWVKPRIAYMSTKRRLYSELALPVLLVIVQSLVENNL